MFPPIVPQELPQAGHQEGFAQESHQEGDLIDLHHGDLFQDGSNSFWAFQGAQRIDANQSDQGDAKQGDKRKHDAGPIDLDGSAALVTIPHKPHKSARLGVGPLRQEIAALRNRNDREFDILRNELESRLSEKVMPILQVQNRAIVHQGQEISLLKDEVRSLKSMFSSSHEQIMMGGDQALAGISRVEGQSGRLIAGFEEFKEQIAAQVHAAQDAKEEGPTKEGPTKEDPMVGTILEIMRQMVTGSARIGATATTEDVANLLYMIHIVRSPEEPHNYYIIIPNAMFSLLGKLSSKILNSSVKLIASSYTKAKSTLAENNE